MNFKVLPEIILMSTDNISLIKPASIGLVLGCQTAKNIKKGFSDAKLRRSA